MEPGDRPKQTPDGLWPGLYRRTDDQWLAIHAPAIEMPEPAPALNWRSNLSQLADRYRGSVDLTPFVILVSLGAALIAVIAWPSSRITSRRRIAEQTVSSGRVA